MKRFLLTALLSFVMMMGFSQSVKTDTLSDNEPVFVCESGGLLKVAPSEELKYLIKKDYIQYRIETANSKIKDSICYISVISKERESFSFDTKKLNSGIYNFSIFEGDEIFFMQKIIVMNNNTKGSTAQIK